MDYCQRDLSRVSRRCAARELDDRNLKRAELVFAHLNQPRPAAHGHARIGALPPATPMAIATPVGSHVGSLPAKAPFAFAFFSGPDGAADERACYSAGATSNDASDNCAAKCAA